MRPDDLALLRLPGRPSISADGRRIAVAVTRLDLEADEYRSQIFVVPTDGSAPPRPFTLGNRDTEPVFSPDGQWLAFCREQPGGKPQPYVMPADGGEPRRVAEHPLGVSSPVWSPDSGRLAYLARVPEPGRYETSDGKGPEREPPRRITTFRYRLDNVGFTNDRRKQLFVVDALSDGAQPRQLTGGPYDVETPSWVPGADALLVASARHEDWDSTHASDVWLVSASTGELTRVTRTTTTVDGPVGSVDGSLVYFLGTDQLDLAGRVVGVWVVPVDGSSAPVRLSDPVRHHLSDMTFSPTLRPVDGGVIAAAAERGGVALLRFSNGGGPPRELLTGNRQARGFDVCQASGAIAATVATATSSGEVLVILPSGEERTLSSFGAELEQANGVLPLEEVEARAPDGYPVHGWIVRPPGDGPHPVVLLVHGGPFTQYGYGLFDEAQVYAGAGYAVVMGNPRGSAGYGEVHGRAIVGDFGNLDVLDVLSLLDAALQTDGLDSSRVGVMGGSYGGFMTSWLLTHTDRFRAAISERAVNDFASLVGTSDIGWYFSDLYNGVDPERVREQSPINYVHPGCPPTLIIHSEQDWRTPLEQGQRFYVALKRAGVEAELLLFPGEGHELSRSGRPSHRLQRFAAVLDWWGRHL